MRRRAFGILALVVACSGFNEDAPNALLTTELSRQTIRVGESVTIRVTVQNVGFGVLRFEGNQCNRQFEVLDAAGSVVAPRSDGICLLFSQPVALERERSFPFPDVVWRAESRASSETTTVLLTPGTYSVRARLPITGVTGEVVGNAVPLVITP